MTRIYLTDPGPFKITTNQPSSVFADLSFLSSAADQVLGVKPSTGLGKLGSRLCHQLHRLRKHKLLPPLPTLSSLFCVDLSVTVSFSPVLFLNFAIRFDIIVECLYVVVDFLEKYEIPLLTGFGSDPPTFAL